MPQGQLFELCVESLEAALVADRGGASRIELCTRLDIGGLTPQVELTQAVVKALRIPVYVLIRPRGGDFVYSDAEFALMCRQVEECKAAGAAGVVIGILRKDGRIDEERSRKLAEVARPMGVTYNRAFDHAPDLDEALESVVRSGADYLLTSGGAANVIEGAASLAHLNRRAGDRLRLIAGGGLKLANLQEVLEVTSLDAFHGSLKRKPLASHRPAEVEDHGPLPGADRLSAEEEAALKVDLAEALAIFSKHAAGR